jgi:hypothetical protein
MLSIAQIGMNTADMAGSLRLLSEVFGFVNAGGQALWGPAIRVQGLPDDSRAVMWWLLGRDPGMQLELFQHSRPAQRPLHADWRPCDLGWVRYGVAVADFDRALAALAANGIAPIAPPVVRDERRRLSFRDPYVGCIIEMLEDGADGLPSVRYATSSVSDIASARHHYETALGLTIEPIETLHLPEDEACWGLPGAIREAFVAHCGGVRLEIVAYRDPLGRAKTADYRTSDQGIVNVALSTDTPAEAETLFDRLTAAGLASPHIARGAGLVSGYITAFEREIEIVCLPSAVRRVIGFEPVTPFIAAMA